MVGQFDLVRFVVQHIRLLPRVSCVCNGLKRVKACATIFVKDECGLCVWCIMSSDAADQVNLSYSAGKSDPVQRTSARVRKPNSSLDHEGASLE